MDTVAGMTLALVLISVFSSLIDTSVSPSTFGTQSCRLPQREGTALKRGPYRRIRGRKVCEGSKRMFTMEPMTADHRKLLMELVEIVSNTGDRIASLRLVADLLKSSGGYRWVGLYDVDRMAGVVRNIVEWTRRT